MNARFFEEMHGALRNRFVIATSAVFLGFTPPSSLIAASATWAGTGNTAWNIGANWSGGTSPGALSGQTNLDTASFNNALSGLITVDANRNLQNILFGNATGVGNFTLGGGSILLSAGGNIQADSTFAGDATVAAGLNLQGNTSLINNGTANSILSVNTITTGTGLGAVTLNLSGSANVGVLGILGNNIQGVISQGAGTTLALNYTGPGTWITLSQNTYTGGTTLNGGTLTVSNTTPLGTTGAITIAGSSTLRTVGAMSDASSRMLINDGATFTYDTANNNSTWASALQVGTSKTGALTKTGLGTLTIALTGGAAEQYTGATTVNAGTVLLDYSVAASSNANIINPASRLVLGGGVLNVKGASISGNISQTFNGSTLNTGVSNFTPNSNTGTVVVDFGNLTRNPGSLFGIATTAGYNLKATGSTNDAGGVLRGVIYGNNDFATLTSGTIGAALYTTTGSAASWTSGAVNYRHNSGSITGTVGTAAINSLNLNSVTSNSFVISNQLTVNDGILFGSGIGNHASVMSGGSLTGPANDDLLIVNNNNQNNNAYNNVASNIVDNGVTGLVLASFQGTLWISGPANSYSGNTTIGGSATVNVSGTGATLGSVNKTVLIKGYGGTNNKLQIGNGDTTGDVKGLIQLEQGTLSINRVDSTGNPYSLSAVVSGSTGAGTLSIDGAGSTNVTLASGVNNFWQLKATAAGQMTLSGSGSVNSFASMLAGNANSNLTFASGSYYLPGGGFTGNLAITGANVYCNGGRNWHSGGGTDTISAGALYIAGDRWDPGESSGSNTITINLNGTGLLDVPSSNYGITIGAAAASGSVSLNQSGGTFQCGVSANINNTGSNNGLTIGQSGATVRAVYNLSGGTSRIAGTISAPGLPATGGTNAFNWTGGTLTVSAINMTNLASNDGVLSASSGTLYQAGGTLAPGDNFNGAALSGKTTITGAYVIDSGTLAIRLGGTTAAANFHDLPTNYDNVGVNGPVTLGGTLAIYVPRPFAPLSSDTFTVLTSSGSTAAISGSFQNVNFGARMPTADGLGSFLVTKSGTSIVLSQYVDNFLPIITLAPVATQAQIGQSASLSIAANNPVGGALTYQWYRNGTAITGATSATLTISNAAKTDSGTYYVVVSNSSGSTASPTTTLYAIDAVALCYQMDQAPVSGVNAIIDATGNTAGTLMGTPLPVSVPGAIAATGNAWDSTSTPAYLSIPATAPALQNVGNLRNATGMTIAFWYNFNQDVVTDWQYRTVAKLGNTLNVNFYKDFDNGSLNFIFGNDINTAAFSVAADDRGVKDGGPTDGYLHGKWHHYAVTLDYRNPVDVNGVAIKNVLLYVDGKLQGTYPNTGQLAYAFQDSFAPNATDALLLGATSSGAPAKWDQFMILNYPMSQSAIQQLCTTGSVPVHAPVVLADANSHLVQLPSPSVNLTGTALNFGQGGALTTTWTKVSGPTGGTVTFGNASSLNTTATFSSTVVGTYVLALTANNSTLSGSAKVYVKVVNPTPPTVYASAGGLPTTTVLTGSSVSLSGASNSYGVPNPVGATYLWTKVSGPGTASFVNATAPSTTVSFNAPGTYVLNLAATSGSLTGNTTMTITVADDLSPVVPASTPNQIIPWPTNTVSLVGSVTQTNPNNPLTYTWTQLSGSGVASFGNSASASTTATFSTPGVYSLQLAVSNGITSGNSAPVWVNVWDVNLGTDVNVRPPVARQLSAVPPPYVHPRFFFTEADRADLTSRANNDAMAKTGIASITANVNNTLLNPATPLGRAYQQMLAGNSTYSVQAVATQQNFYKVMSQACYLAWVQQNNTWLQQLATVLANSARNELIWAGTTPPYVSQIDDLGLALCYDLTYNSMTEDQRVDTRALLAAFTAAHTWIYSNDWNCSNVGNLVLVHFAAMPAVIYGEPGYNSTTATQGFTALKAFYSKWGISQGGIPRDDVAYHDGWDIWAQAGMLAWRGIEPLTITSRMANESQNEFYFLAPNTVTDAPKPIIYGHDDGQGWAQWLDTLTIRKYLYPTEKLEDFVYREGRKTSSAFDPLFDAIFGMEPAAIPPTFASVSADRGLPLTKFDPQRCIGFARSDWGVDAAHLDFENRFDIFNSGHEHSGRCNFTFFGLGRSWVNDSGYHQNVNESHSTILIDGLGQGFGMPGQLLDVVDHPALAQFVGECADAYKYSYPGYPNPVATPPSGTVNSPFTWGSKFFPGSSDGTIPAFTAPSTIMGDNSWVSLPFNVKGTNGTPTPYNTVQKAFVSAMMVRGSHPYALIVDDIQKDSASHLYQWSVCMDSDMQLRTGTTATDAVVFHTGDGSGIGAPQCLVRALQADGTQTPITLATSAINTQTENRLMIGRNGIAPNYKVLLFPHLNGDALPTTTWNGNVLTVALADGQTDRFTFAAGADGRTRISLVRTSDTVAPVISVPANINVPATSSSGATVNFTAVAYDAVDGTVPVNCNPTSGSTFPVGTTTVTCTATDANGNTGSASFTITVMPPIPTAPAGLSAIAWDGEVDLSWAATQYAISYKVKRSTTNGGPYTTIASNVTPTYWTDVTATNGTTYYYVVSAVNTAGEGPNSTQVSASPVRATGFNAWSAGDIGSVAYTGSASYLSGTYTVAGSGADIWSSADGFQFVSQSLSGDGTIYALVTSETNTSPYAKAGVMMRNTLAANSMEATMLVNPNQCGFQYRTTTGGGTGQTINVNTNKWVKITRVGNSFTGYSSANGITWTQVGTTQTLAMSSTIYVGLAVSAHNNTAVCTATFANVNIVPGGPWSAQDIGSPQVAGFTSYSGSSSGVLTLNAAGADINGTSDQFRYAYLTGSNTSNITARVAGVAASDPWAKGGLMIRDGLAPSSAYYSILATANNGVIVQSRTVAGAASTSTAIPGVTLPCWLRITRSTSSFTAYTSSNGTTWTAANTMNFVMGATPSIGAAATSHNATDLGTATFDNITATP